MNLNCHLLKCHFGEYIFPQRYLICIMALFGVTMSFNLRSIVNIALIKMVIGGKKNPDSEGHQCSEIAATENTDIHLTGGTLAWTEDQQGFIIAAFFPSFVLTQIFGGVLADKFGGKPLLSLGILLSAFLSIITPLGITIGGWKVFIVLRALMGLFLGATFPSVFTIMAKWVPFKERGILGAIITSGNQLGNITSILGTTALISHSKSWKLPFYVWGIVSIIWCKLFNLMCFSEPSENPFMSEKETALLEEELGGLRSNTKFKIPWIKILTCKPVLAMTVCMVGHVILSLFLSIHIAKYRATVLKSNVTTDGTSTAIPYLAMFISGIVSGYLSDLFIRKKIMSVSVCRKVFCGLGGILPALFLILVSYMGCSGKNVSVMIIMCRCLMGPLYPSLLVNSTDLSKNFSATITSIATSLGTLLFFPWPNIIAAIAANHTLQQWKIVMWMTGTIGVICTVVFLLWGSSDRQEFDTIE